VAAWRSGKVVMGASLYVGRG